jgi:NAD+ diphosphatase
MGFAPSVSAPARPSRPALLFLCRGGEVAVAGDGIPALERLPEGLELHYLGALDGVDCFAAALEGDEPGDGLEVRHLRGLYGELPDDVWALAGRAAQIVEWERTHRFCGVCGGPTEPAPGERARRCPDCGYHAYPRLSPAVIVLVRRGRELLLARGVRWTDPVYSCIAGFVDPGESLEEAVVREVREETGVEIADVRYFGSQPWPFPHSLMIGFTASFAAGEIRIDEDELVDARWFSPGDLPMLPAPLSIARRLIDSALPAEP